MNAPVDDAARGTFLVYSSQRTVKHFTGQRVYSWSAASQANFRRRVCSVCFCPPWLWRFSVSVPGRRPQLRRQELRIHPPPRAMPARKQRLRRAGSIITTNTITKSMP